MAKTTTKPETETDERDTVDSLKQVLSKLSQCLEKLTDDADSKRVSRKRLEKQQRRSLLRDIEKGEAEEALIAGDTFFMVHLGPKEPVMPRFVGVKDTGNADANALLAARKYEAYFGLNGAYDKNVCPGPIVEPLNSLPSLEDEKAWQPMQRKNIVGGRNSQASLAELSV